MKQTPSYLFVLGRVGDDRRNRPKHELCQHPPLAVPSPGVEYALGKNPVKPMGQLGSFVSLPTTPHVNGHMVGPIRIPVHVAIQPCHRKVKYRFGRTEIGHDGTHWCSVHEMTLPISLLRKKKTMPNGYSLVCKKQCQNVFIVPLVPWKSRKAPPCPHGMLVHLRPRVNKMPCLPKPTTSRVGVRLR